MTKVTGLVTVDCGTMAHEVLAGAFAQGVDVIVADHHQTGGGLPDCYALVNPRRADDDSDMEHLAAVGVTFAGGRAEPLPAPNGLVCGNRHG